MDARLLGLCGELSGFLHIAVAQRLLRQQRATKVQFAVDFLTQPALELLCHDFTQDDLFGEILRANRERPRARAALP